MTYSAAGLLYGGSALDGVNSLKEPRKSSQLKPSERFNTYQVSKEIESASIGAAAAAGGEYGASKFAANKLESHRTARNALAKISMTSEGSPRPPLL